MRPRLKAIFLLISLLLIVFSASASVEEREFRVINAAHDLADNSAQIVTCTKTGRMIIATIGNLNFYDGASFSHIDTHLEYQFQLPLYRGNYHLYFDNRHHLWLKNTGVVTCVDMKMEKFIPDVESVIKEMGCKDVVLDLFVDHSGQVWLLTEEGLYGVDCKKTYQVLRDRNLQDLEVMDNMLLTFYDNGEEMAQNLKTGDVVHRSRAYDWDDAQLYSNSSVLQHYGKGFFQIRNGAEKSVLLRFDVADCKWAKLMEMPYHLNNMAIEKDHIYLPSEYGYWVYDIKTGEQTHVGELKLQGTDKKLNTDCNMLAFDKQGGMWIGTERRGLLYAHPYVSPFKAYTWDTPEAQEYGRMMDNLTQNVFEFEGKQANCVYADSRNWLWYGTTTGLYLCKQPNADPVLFDKKDGLLNNVIHSIVEDLHHDIWVSTSCGISCILFEGEKPVFVNSFNEHDNVPNESFINCKALRLDDGTIVMQALDHVVAFNPGNITHVNSRKPMVFYPKLIRLLVNGNTVTPGVELDGNMVIDRAITRVKEISLNADQNSILLTFSGLNYFRPLQTYYRVRLPGLDDEYHVYSYFNGSDFVDEQGKLHLQLIGLKPGTFNIEVQASMFPDVWPGEPYIWTVYVNQPWWQATGAYMILAIIVLALLVVNFFLYNRNTRMRTRRNSEEGDMIRKIRSFVDRFDNVGTEKLVPLHDEVYADAQSKSNMLDPEFITLMLKLIPYVHQVGGQGLTMRKLSTIGGVDMVKLYEIMSTNLYKSPRSLVMLSRLQKAAELLRTTQRPVEQIAQECGFDTPNFLMGSFFHQYKLTPAEYREDQHSDSR